MRSRLSTRRLDSQRPQPPSKRRNVGSVRNAKPAVLLPTRRDSSLGVAAGLHPDPVANQSFVNSARQSGILRTSKAVVAHDRQGLRSAAPGVEAATAGHWLDGIPVSVNKLKSHQVQLSDLSDSDCEPKQGRIEAPLVKNAISSSEGAAQAGYQTGIKMCFSMPNSTLGTAGRLDPTNVAVATSKRRVRHCKQSGPAAQKEILHITGSAAMTQQTAAVLGSSTAYMSQPTQDSQPAQGRKQLQFTANRHHGVASTAKGKAIGIKPPVRLAMLVAAITLAGSASIIGALRHMSASQFSSTSSGTNDSSAAGQFADQPTAAAAAGMPASAVSDLQHRQAVIAAATGASMFEQVLHQYSSWQGALSHLRSSTRWRPVSMHGGSGHGSSDGSNAVPAAAAASVPAVGIADQNKQTADEALPPDAIAMYAVVGDTAVSPYKGANWGAVVRHMARRLRWTDNRFNLRVYTQEQLASDKSAKQQLAAALLGSSNSGSRGSGQGSKPYSPIFVGIAVTDPTIVAFLNQATAQLPTAMFWDSAPELDSSSRVDGFAPATAGPLAQLLAKNVGFTNEARAARVLDILNTLWGRRSSDDLLYTWLVVLNEYVTPVPSVANTTKGTDLPSFLCMVKNCGQQIVGCITDSTCKKGLDCLNHCSFNDQVCQYRCIVSYETPKFNQFALCILQLHNCRGLDAKVPMVPNPSPIGSWRGSPLTHEVAESLFIGWKSVGPQLPKGGQVKPWSWLVASGKNPVGLPWHQQGSDKCAIIHNGTM
eukprot:GHRR01020186.1.p1 GENE.GHRR01020186.1~~GHRR01020186.1.p1  ORF type:complete len:765 (+),score=228.66 GHRR01020186.1:201-2495(+)